MSDNEDNKDFNPEEEVAINEDNKINLPKDIVVKTGEEDEDLIYKVRGRLYRFRKDEWKERGTGEIRFLRNNADKKIRFILRQDKTLKVVANFYFADKPLCELASHQGSDKMFFFLAYDCSDETPSIEKFVLKLGNAEIANNFKTNFEAAKKFVLDAKDGKDVVFAPVIKSDKDEKKDEEK